MNRRLVCVLLSASMASELRHISALPHIEYSIPEFPVVIRNIGATTATAAVLAPSALMFPTMVKK